MRRTSERRFYLLAVLLAVAIGAIAGLADVPPQAAALLFFAAFLALGLTMRPRR